MVDKSGVIGGRLMYHGECTGFSPLALFIRTLMVGNRA